jgi:hypothetical protein
MCCVGRFCEAQKMGPQGTLSCLIFSFGRCYECICAATDIGWVSAVRVTQKVLVVATLVNKQMHLAGLV